MNSITAMPANSSAERIVRHFQAAGFTGITEAMVIRIRLKKADRHEVEAAFDRAADLGAMPPLAEYFEIRPYGFYSELRSFAQAKTEMQLDFGVGLRGKVPSIYFDVAPVVIDDALATGTKYDALVKFSDNMLDYALAVLLNDPTSSFFEYLGTHRGIDWQKIIGDFGAAATTYDQDVDLF
ncbi:hypothetical protein [Noviherbaspirillum sedimenti]|uniref:Uncharacterized protein n=1 Tax=Noviherbaspirillum sedimenti TaxID=2320865 RepID=A0A3A3GAW1_9BURK|nr:hypothetical protein [Noviherbaspirillum sedimenti]RJG03909.1 hypothetical protein D3878_21850 [Noviherbaspirillum sedimenti]